MNKEIALQKIINPRKYDHVVGYPGEYDAAEFLLINYWGELSHKMAVRISTILIRSGKYI